MKRTRKPGIAFLLIRVIVITVLVTLLAFTVALFLGIAGIVFADMIRGGGINLTSAYRHVAVPVACVVMVLAFVASLVNEIRYYRRARAGVSPPESKLAA
jgi:TRAP-type C4-dicarboxylate transport system permease small subunit